MSSNSPARLSRWAQRLSSLPSLALPTDYPRPQAAKLVEAVHSSSLPSAASLALVQLALAHPTASPYHLLLAAFTVLLHRYTGDTTLIVGSSSAKAGDPLVLKIDMAPEESFANLVKCVQAVEAEAQEDVVPFEELVAHLAKSGSAEQGQANAPLFRVRFFDETDNPAPEFLRSTSLTTDLTVFVTSAPTAARSSLVPSLELRIAYNALLFSAQRIAFLSEQLAHLLTLVAGPSPASVGALPLLTDSQRAVLPNPRDDLDWTGYKGAITDIFSSNARKHPERACIVESLESGEGKRVWTYQQIDEASNVLAHHLIKGGVQREEVVMVYAFRGVDLVVAVMGVLKAGATFSVIDPAYPPTRQTVYLQVARPRALVVLARAGTLSPNVRSFIDSELDLRLEVPALKLLPDGLVGGGAPDVLAEAQTLKAQHPGVVLGPDSVGTLSFTSGSTGIPKGVKGRHYSLTHFFPWMSERFGLTEKEKFTMLSGIAHDPIQRDIFTPLFLGAELHVPTADDIGTPGRLAEWMADSEVTVTHLTPAMGQLLSAQATRQITTLRNAFFVGDVLTKRDCHRLQSLAQNVRINNMYGTTETQRAVSYFAIPPVAEESTFLGNQKHIMPAGAGMIDVQLLVVNRTDRNVLCAVGEVGEIYVRSGGLAEGYLDPEATKEKFVSNWFGEGVERADAIARPAGGSAPPPYAPYWLGVRDRMYRTGDLGRYGPDGQVECTGRADDQVKIRGFRIELGEIDTHLSAHPLVRENVTLVRRDKDEEKVLVSYFVPVQGAGLEGFVSESGEEAEEDDAERAQGPAREIAKGLKRYRKLIKDMREHLKKKLPTYSVPSIFIPLTRMPLNPNGKIDKPALPFPDTALAAPRVSSNKPQPALSPIEQTIHDIWQRLLSSAPQSIPVDENFFDLGGHSILATRLIFEIRKAFVVNAPLGLVFDQPTIRGLAAEVEHLRSSDLGLQPAEEPKANGATPAVVTEEEYGKDVDVLLPRLAKSYAAPPEDFSTKPLTVFLTGATGFLGAFVLNDLLAFRKDRVAKVICLVRAADADKALQRLRDSGEGRQAWDEAWVEEGRLEAVAGDLDLERFGLKDAEWERITKDADTIIHNGALVHWVYPYAKLRRANVLSTLTAIELAAAGKPKAFSFVSSTSALDTEYYVRLSDALAQKGEAGVPESDDLEGSRTGLGSGYGQSKWVSEKLIMEAGKRGLRGAIVRPGYVVGDSKSAVTNTDDFIWRLVKGCIQLGLVPDIHNTINMVPVDHVARITALSALSLSPSQPLPVLHVTARPPVRFTDLLGSLPSFGYEVSSVEYLVWRSKLEQHVLDAQDNALFPLLHFVLDDLPTSTKSAELDDANTRAVLEAAKEQTRATVDGDLLGLYLAWLIAAGFLDKPAKKGERSLPEVAQAKAIGRNR